MFNKLRRIFRRTGVDHSIYLAVLVLVVTGIVMIGSASVGMSASYGSNYAYTNMAKQGLFVIIGAGLMIFFARTFKSRFINAQNLLILYIVCLVGMLICLVWEPVNGSYSWIHVGPFTIQPMEFMKIVIILLLSYCFGELPEALNIPKEAQGERRKKMVNRKMLLCFWLPVFLILIVAVVGGFVQNDLGSTLVLGFICLMVFYCTPTKYYSKMKKLSFVVIGICAIALVIGFNTIFQAHQIARFNIWLNPTNSENYYGNGFQYANGLIAYASGGLFGKGFGSSTQKYGYIPEAYNDSISAIIAEELGVVGLVVLVFIPYIVIIVRLFHYGQKIKETKSKLILYGVAAYFFTHLLVNIGGVSGLIPMTGVPLLLVSSGGSSAVAALISIGLCQAIIYRYNRDQLKEQIE